MKQKRDVRLIVFGVILLFFIAGCGGEGGETTKKSTFIGGGNGLDIQFLGNTPPAEVTDGNSFPFNVIVKLKNQGEYPIPKDKVKVSLIGFDPSDFNVAPGDLTDKTPSDDLIAMQKDPEGNVLESPETLVIFPNDASMFSYTDTIDANSIYIFRADVCYQYRTTAVSEVCVLENIIDVTEDSICTPTGSKDVSNSGSPISVTEFRQNIGGQTKVQLSFDIEHRGSGRIYELRDPILCPKDSLTIRNMEDIVHVELNTGITGALNCAGLTTTADGAEGSVRLFNGKRTITCTQELPSGSNYIKPVSVNLDFVYFDKADAEVLVRRAGGTMI